MAIRVVISGGGTGGHTSPAVAIVDELRRRDPDVEIEWMGKAGSVEEGVAVRARIPFFAIPAAGWPRGNHLKKARVLAVMASGAVTAFRRLRRLRPDCVVGVGGYVSLPALWAAQRLRIPTVLHEQNKRLGLANRVLAKRAARLLLSYPDTQGAYPRERAVVVGNPVRDAFLHVLEKADACREFSLDASRRVVLVSGGSQGARRINEAVAEVVREDMAPGVQILWMTGHGDYDWAKAAGDESNAAVRVFPFIEDMATACAAADVVICRAGASTTAELAVLGKPSILVPYPHATDNHQAQNAQAFEEAGAAVMLLDEECAAPALAELLQHVLSSDDRLRDMGAKAKTLARPEATTEIVDSIFEVAGKPLET